MRRKPACWGGESGCWAQPGALPDETRGHAPDNCLHASNDSTLSGEVKEGMHLTLASMLE
eukprot:1148577-Pelagomonas_calceolata.AAC.8